MSISSNKRSYANRLTSKRSPEMVSVAMLIGGALVINDIAFTDSFYLF